jgi:hypothetical protein
VVRLVAVVDTLPTCIQKLPRNPPTYLQRHSNVRPPVHHHTIASQHTTHTYIPHARVISSRSLHAIIKKRIHVGLAMDSQQSPAPGTLSWRLSSHPITLLTFLAFRSCTFVLLIARLEDG